MKKLAIVALIVGLFYLPTLLIIQSGNKTIGSYTTTAEWQDMALYNNTDSWSDIWGLNKYTTEDFNTTTYGTDFAHRDYISDNLYYFNVTIKIEEYTGGEWDGSWGNLRLVFDTGTTYLSGYKRSKWFDQDYHTLKGTFLARNDQSDLELKFYATRTTHRTYFKDISLYNITEIYGEGKEPSIDIIQRDLGIWLDRYGEASYGGYEHKTDNFQDIDGWDLGDAKVESLFKFIAQPFTVINKARVQGAEYVGNWTYDTVVKPLVNLGNTLSENIENYIDGLWLDIYGLGEDIKDALYKIWDGATFWN